jgi:hypothetical protein
MEGSDRRVSIRVENQAVCGRIFQPSGADMLLTIMAVKTLPKFVWLCQVFFCAVLMACFNLFIFYGC